MVAPVLTTHSPQAVAAVYASLGHLIVPGISEAAFVSAAQSQLQGAEDSRGLQEGDEEGDQGLQSRAFGRVFPTGR